MVDAETSAARSHAATDFVDGVVRVAFLVRLVALLFVLLLPVSELVQRTVLGTVGLIAVTSVVGFYRYRDVADFARRHPLAAVLDVLLAAGVTALVGADSPLILYTLSTALLVGVLLPRLPAALLTVVLVLSYALALIEAGYPSRDTLFYVLILPATSVLLVLLGSVARILHEQVLAEHRRVADLLAVAAKQEERARLARDMHDSVAKSLHGIGLAAASLPVWVERDPQAGVHHAQAIRLAAESATQEARALLTDLRHVHDDRPLCALLQERVAEMSERSGVRGAVDVQGDPDIAQTVRAEILRIVDEALENVGRHAAAENVMISCRSADSTLIVEITDDGRGFDIPAGRATRGHFGLQGMEERARAAGGRVELTSVAGRGTTVRVEVPLGDGALVEKGAP